MFKLFINDGLGSLHKSKIILQIIDSIGHDCSIFIFHI
jgi:hypothetical protein